MSDKPSTPVADRPCREGFRWNGMPQTSCDKCGLPVWDHEGRSEPFYHRVTMELLWRLKPWKPEERELLRRRYEGQITGR